jgi:hypothetical protein
VVHWLVPDTARVGSHRHGARYATDCFPPAVAAGALLERHSRRATVGVITGLAFREVASLMFFIARGSLI